LFIVQVEVRCLTGKADVPGKGFAWFSVSGQWLKCINPEVIAKLRKYGKASVGAPPMSVPHRFKND
jgi:malate dehydrogenase (quinone)